MSRVRVKSRSKQCRESEGSVCVYVLLVVCGWMDGCLLFFRDVNGRKREGKGEECGGFERKKR